MFSSFFKPFYYVFLLIFILIFFLSCFFGPTILGGLVTQEDTYYDFSLDSEYIWPTPRIHYY